MRAFIATDPVWPLRGSRGGCSSQVAKLEAPGNTVVNRLLQTSRLPFKVAAAVLLAAVPAAVLATAITSAASSIESAQAHLARLGLPWVPNAGQWDGRAAFRAQSFAGTVWVTTDGRVLHAFNGPKATRCGADAGDSVLPALPLVERKRAASCPREGGWVLAERFVGGRVAQIEGRDQQAGRVSFEVGATERRARGLPSYGTLDLGEVFPGVQVALKATQSNVEKLYTVAPGHDPGVIRMAIEGAQRLDLGNDGRLIVQTGHGETAFTPPVAFQYDARGERQPVAVAYRLAGDSYYFALGAYDRSRALTIDPLLQSTYLGGGGAEAANALAIHPISGEVYLAGETLSTDLPSATGGAQAIKGAFYDAFISRFNAALTSLLQTTYLGGEGDDRALALAIHPVSGDVYVTGQTASTDLPGVSGGAQATKGASIDAYISRFNAALTGLLQTTYLGGDGNDVANALAIHPLSGDVYVAGRTVSTDLPGAGGGAQAAKGGLYDGFISRFNAALTSQLQSTYQGGDGVDIVNGLAIHPLSGEIYVAGHTESTDLPGASGGAQATYGTGFDAFISRFNATLTSRLQSTYLGGEMADIAYGLAIHPLSGDVYVAGFTDSADLPGASGGAQATTGSATDAFVSRFNAALTSRLQSTYLGGDGTDNAFAVAIHPVSGEVYVAGRTDSTELPGATGGTQATKGAGVDGIVSRFNATLTSRLQSTYVGGGGTDVATALAIHPVSGEVYVAGRTDSTDLPGVSGGAQAAKGAGTDAFISRLSLDLSGANVVPNAFVLPAQFGVPVSGLRTAGPVQVTGLGALAPVTVDGALGSAVCVSSGPSCNCDASPGGVFGPSGNIANNQYLCVRHVSAATASTFAESRVVVGGRAAKLVSFTGTLPACLLDMNGDGTLLAMQEMLVLTRATLGFPSAAAVAGTGITEAQWLARRDSLIACGNVFP